jgi:hypothetical protein
MRDFAFGDFDFNFVFKDFTFGNFDFNDFAFGDFDFVLDDT